MSNQRRRRNRSDSKTARGLSTRRGRATQRHLLAERLEDRLLLAADVNPWHNVFVPTDVDRNYLTTPMDALWVINDLNANGARELAMDVASDVSRPFYDTNGDGTVSAIDALQVINRLNNGEGEPGDWVGIRLEAQDLNGNPLPNNTIKTGEKFRLQVYTQDLRGFDADGVFAAFVDIAYNNPDLFTLVWGETQRMTLDPATNGGNYTLSFDGETSGPIPLGTSISQATTNLRLGLESLLNIDIGDVEVTNRGTQDNPFIWDIKFSGQYENTDVPLIVGNFSNLTPGAGSSAVTDRFPPDPEDPNTFRSSFIGTDLYVDSLTAWPFSADKDGDQVIDEFDEVGSVQGNTNFPADRGLDPSAEYPVIHTFLIADAPGDLTFTSNFAEMIASYVLVYGIDEQVPETLVDYGDPLTVTIIQPVNAVDDEFPLPGNQILEETTVQLDVLANDFLADQATGPLAIDPAGFVDLPDHGSVSVVGGLVEYTPDLNYFGTDSFIYTAIDINGDSDTATVTLTITNVNDAPVATNDGIANIGSVLEDSVSNPLDVLANDNGGGGPLEEGETIFVSAVTQPPNGMVSIGAGGANVIYTPDGNFFGTDTFTYTVSDGGLTATATVSVVVVPVNDDPIAVDDSLGNIPEDSPGVTIDVLSNDNGGGGPLEENEPISVVGVTQPPNGTVQIGAGGANVFYIPDDNFFGTETFEYTISDGDLEATAEVTVTVVNINDPPVAVDDDEFVDEFSTDNVLTVLGNDTPGPSGFESEALTITNVTPATYGTVSISGDGQTLIYTPRGDVFGPETDTFDYTITDGEFFATATVTVEIEPIIRPRARDDQYTVLEDSNAADNELDVTANDLLNEDANKLPIVITTPPVHGTATVVNDFFVQYEPFDNYFGPDSFEYQIDDDFTGGPSDPDIGLVTINVTNVNDPPVANDDTELGIPEDVNNYPIDVLANDETGPLGPGLNPEQDNLLLVGVTQPTNGFVSISADGKMVLYSPDDNFFGSDSFTYTMTDGEFQRSATVDVVVDNINDPPEANNDLATVDEDSGFNTILVRDNDNAGPGGESEDFTVVQVGGATHGMVSIGNNGLTVLYKPNDNYNGPDSFTYTISDGQYQDAATVSVTVRSVNDDPTANPDDALALKNFVDQEIEVLGNDTFAPDINETLTIIGLGPNDESQATTSKGGTVRLDGQRILYTPAVDFVDDLDTFTYTISDGNGGFSTALVTVDVVGAVPSDISGKAYLDVNNNGKWDPQEIVLGGVEVTLDGLSIRGENVHKTVLTGSDGVFLFEGVFPNEVGDPNGYTLSAVTPEFVVDGTDSMMDSTVDDDLNPGTAYDDEFRSIELGLFGTERAENNYMFGERGLSSQYISLAQYLSSTRKGLAAATNMEGDDYWYAVMEGWEGIQSVHVQLAQDLTSAELTVVDSAGTPHNKTITYKDYYVAGRDGEYMVYFNGSAADFGIVLPGDEVAQSDGPAEGEALTEAEQIEMLAARGQRDFAKAVDIILGDDGWA